MPLSIRICFLSAMLLFPVCSFGAETLRLVQPVLTDSKEGGMKNPQGVTCNDRGDFVVADTGNGRLLTYTYKEGVVNGGGEVKVPQMVYPTRLQMNSKGEIFVLDGKLRRIIRLNAKGGFLGFFEPQGMPPSAAPVIRSFKLDAKDAIYLLDIFSERVLIFDPAGKYQREITFPASHGFIADLAVNPNGDIYLIDSGALQVYAAAKDATTFTPLTKTLGEYLEFPVYITTDGKGSIYVVDQNGGGVIVLGQDGSFRTRMLSMGWKPGFLYYPSQICLDGKGDLYVADRDNSRAQIFEISK